MVQLHTQGHLPSIDIFKSSEDSEDSEDSEAIDYRLYRPRSIGLGAIPHQH